MKVFATSDLHGNLPDIPECDLLLIGGDICPDFFHIVRRPRLSRVSQEHKGEQEQLQWLDTTFRAWLDRIPAKQVVGIAGNHDFVFETDHTPVTDHLRWTYLQDNEVTIDGLRIYGTPWVPNLPFWAFHAGMVSVKDKFESIPKGVDVLLSHGPFYGAADKLAGYSLTKRDINVAARVGCKRMAKLVNVIEPKVFICGHVHEGYGWYPHTAIDYGVYNVSHCTDSYNPINKVVHLHDYLHH